MTRSEIRDLVNRRLQQPAAGDRWSEAELNTAINLGYQAAQARVLEGNPEAFIRIDRAALVADQHEYAKPVGMVSLLELAIKDSTSGLYTPVECASFHDLRDRSGSETLETKYAELGRWWYIDPAPDASLAAGLQATFVPALSLAADTSVPQLSFLWHMVIVINTQLILIGETSDEATGLMNERAYLYAQLGLIRKSSAPERPISLTLNRSYRKGASTSGRW